MYKIHESITLFNNSASVSHMFTLSAFKPSSGINQDYANGKKMFWSLPQSWSWVMIENLTVAGRRYFTMLASEMWSMLATSIAMATFTGGPAGGEVRKESKPAPSPVQTHTRIHAHLLSSFWIHQPPIFTPLPICFCPTHHPPTSQTLLQCIEIKHYPV